MFHVECSKEGEKKTPARGIFAPLYPYLYLYLYAFVLHFVWTLRDISLFLTEMDRSANV